ncbi:unnamed protein product [Gongylonema pulchrum]|uniref:C2 PI3K-type domain-containing protein n=1 Tax=Gongylonema pulchrum TaxID=637853 RepID=A0A183DZR8_9BILA|nr:unnamed protein product [Gongylonema pulchrum]
MMDSEFLYVHSCDLDQNLQIRIGSLEGSVSLLDKSYRVVGGNFFVTITVYCNKRQVGTPVSTSYKPPPSSARALHSWDEWLSLPIKINELSLDSFLHACLWDVSESLEPRFVAHSSISLFSKRGMLRSGSISLKMEMASSGDDHLVPPPPAQFTKQTGIDRLHKLMKEYGENLIEHVDWLDRITYPRIKQLEKEYELEQRCPYLNVEMIRVVAAGITYSVVYYESEEDEAKSQNGGAGPCTDPELGLENLCETKHSMMTRNKRAGIFERELKPNAAARDALERIIQADFLTHIFGSFC